MGVFFEKHIIWVFEKNRVTRLQPFAKYGGLKFRGYVNTIFCSFT